jgi:hypothetical protein
LGISAPSVGAARQRHAVTHVDVCAVRP